ncbi:hypothetical protein AVEN_135522-1 [Araneus ventricosus]|uniref:Tc1-like transposase DDE domain-containing protein n=1 Tax=Araneus ventricosus TaxID=182803 RepID=A0A4Y2NL00_ARAVE|nr:hypothetical protein AVEN_135522-1 [Araneus ventricosus]
MGYVMTLLRNQFIPALQQCGCVESTIFIQDGTPPHIAIPVKQLLNLHFGNDRTISRHFPTAWPPQSPDLNPYDSCLWGYLKDIVYGSPTANLAELKNRITEHIHNITTETLRSVVEHAILCFELMRENGGQHIRHFLASRKRLPFLMVSSVFSFSTVLSQGTVKNRFHFLLFSWFLA